MVIRSDVTPHDPISIWASLPFRSSETEWMDNIGTDAEVLRLSLGQLETLNRFLGGHQSLIRGFRRALPWVSKRRLRVVDVGCGGGDGVRLMAAWCTKHNLEAEIVGLDFNPNVVDAARELSKDYSNVRYVQGDAFGGAVAELSPDIVTATLFCHHFPSTELGPNLATLLQATNALVISDLHRHPVAHASFRALGRVVRLSPMTRHDGAISVRRGFKRHELEALVAPLGARHMSIHWAFAFRYEVLLVR